MFNFFKKKEEKPVSAPAQSKEALRDLLFGNLPAEKWLGNKKDVPWSLFAQAFEQASVKKDNEAAVKTYKKVVDTPGLETRHYLQAWYFLRKLGVNPLPEIAQNVYGVVVDVFLETGSEVVACYADHHARYINYQGRGVYWDLPNTSLNEKIDALLKASEVPARNKAFDERLPPPTQVNAVQISILTPGGIPYGMGTFEGWSKDPFGGPIVVAAGALLNGLVEKALAK